MNQTSNQNSLLESSSNINQQIQQGHQIYKEFQKYNSSIRVLNSISEMKLLKEKRGNLLNQNSFQPQLKKIVIHRSSSVQQMLRQADKDQNNAVVKVKDKLVLNKLGNLNQRYMQQEYYYEQSIYSQQIPLQKNINNTKRMFQYEDRIISDKYLKKINQSPQIRVRNSKKLKYFQNIGSNSIQNKQGTRVSNRSSQPDFIDSQRESLTSYEKTSEYDIKQQNKQKQLAFETDQSEYISSRQLKEQLMSKDLASIQQKQNTDEIENLFPLIKSSNNQDQQGQKLIFDPHLGEPYLKIKMRNLTNYKNRPLFYYDFDKEKDEIINKKIQNKQDSETIIALSRHLDNLNNIVWNKCKVLCYNDEKEEYIIEWLHNQKQKTVQRLNLMFEGETEEELLERQLMAQQIRYLNIYFENYKIQQDNQFKDSNSLYCPIKTFKNIFNKVMVHQILKNQTPQLNQKILEILDEIVFEYKLESARFMFEFRNTKGNLRKILKTRYFHDSKVNLQIDYSPKHCEFVINFLSKEPYQLLGNENQQMHLSHNEADLKLIYQNLQTNFRDFMLFPYDQKEIDHPLVKNMLNYQYNIVQNGNIVYHRILSKYLGYPYSEKIFEQFLSFLRNYYQKNQYFYLAKESIKVSFPQPEQICSKKLNNITFALGGFVDIILHNIFLNINNDQQNLLKLDTLEGNYFNLNNFMYFKVSNIHIQEFTDLLRHVENSFHDFRFELIINAKSVEEDIKAKKTLLRINKMIKCLIQSHLYDLVERSLNEVTNFFFQYMAIYPINYPSIKLLNKIDQRIQHMRLFYKNNLLLHPDQNIQSSYFAEQNLYFLSLQNNFYHKRQEGLEFKRQFPPHCKISLLQPCPINKDELFTQILQEMIEKILYGSQKKYQNLKPETQILRPFIQIKLQIIKLTLSKKEKIEIWKQIKSRKDIMGFKQITQFLKYIEQQYALEIADYYQINLSENKIQYTQNSIQEQSSVQKQQLTESPLKKKQELNEDEQTPFVTQTYNTQFTQQTSLPEIQPIHFDEIEGCYLPYFIISPSFNEISLQLEKIISLPLDYATNCIKNKFYQWAESHKEAKVDLNINKSHQELDELLNLLRIPLQVILYIYSNFDYLILQMAFKDDDEAKEIMRNKKQKIKDWVIRVQQIEKLNLDKRFIEKMPSHIQFNIFNIELGTTNNRLLLAINKILEQNHEKILKYFQSIVDKMQNIRNNIMENLQQKVNSIEEYMVIHNYLKSDGYKQNLMKIQQYLKDLQNLSQEMQKNQLLYDCQIYEKYFIAKIQMMRDLDFQKEQIIKKLKERRIYFYELLQETEKKINKQFEILSGDMDRFNYFCKLSECETYNSSAKTIIEKMNTLVQEAYTMNYHQEIIEMELTNIKNIINSYDHFKNHVKLWEFIAEKWKFKSENWLKDPFANLDKNEVNSIFVYIGLSQMTEIINEGIKLMGILAERFELNATILDLVKQIQADVIKQSKYLGIVIKLKDPSFKQRHWEQLFREMYQNNPKKIDLNTVSLEQLIEENIMEYTTVIHIISNAAKIESNLESEIKNIEDSLKAIMLQKVGYKVKFVSPFFFLKDVDQYILLLNTQLANCQSLLFYDEFSTDFMRKLNNIEANIKTAVKCFKTFKRIQNRIMDLTPIIKMESIENLIGKQMIQQYIKLVEETKIRIDVSARVNLFNFYIIPYIQKDLFFFLSLPKVSKGESQIGEKEPTTHETLLPRITAIDAQLEIIQKNCHLLVEEVKQQCPQFQFYSDYTVWDILKSLSFPQISLPKIVSGYCHIKKVMIRKRNYIDKIDKNEELKDFSVIGVKNLNNEKIIFEQPYIFNEFQSSEFLMSFNEILTTLPKNVLEEFKQFFSKNIYKAYNYLQLWENELITNNYPFQFIQLLNDICFFHDMSILLAIDLNQNLSVRNVVDDNIISQSGSNSNIQQLQSSKMLSGSGSSDNFQEQNVTKRLVLLHKLISIALQDLIQYKYLYFNLMNPLATKNKILQFNQLVFQVIYHKEILEFFIEKNVSQITDFEYLYLPKLSITWSQFKMNAKSIVQQSKDPLQSKTNDILGNTLNLGNKILKENIKDYVKQPSKPLKGKSQLQPGQELTKMQNQDSKDCLISNQLKNSNQIGLDLSSKSDYLKGSFQNQDINMGIHLVSSNTILRYNFNFLSFTQNFIYTPFGTTRYYMVMSQALATGMHVLINNDQKTGQNEKKNILKSMAFMVAANIIEYQCSEYSQISQILSICSGMAATGSWCILNEFDLLSQSVLSAMSVVLQIISLALYQEKNIISINNINFPFNSNGRLQFTLSQNFTQIQQLKPHTLHQYFRAITIATPDFLYQIKIILLLFNVSYQQKIEQQLSSQKSKFNDVDMMQYCLKIAKKILTFKDIMNQNNSKNHYFKLFLTNYVNDEDFWPELSYIHKEDFQQKLAQLNENEMSIFSEVNIKLTFNDIFQILMNLENESRKQQLQNVEQKDGLNIKELIDGILCYFKQDHLFSQHQQRLLMPFVLNTLKILFQQELTKFKQNQQKINQAQSLVKNLQVKTKNNQNLQLNKEKNANVNGIDQQIQLFKKHMNNVLMENKVFQNEKIESYLQQLYERLFLSNQLVLEFKNEFKFHNNIQFSQLYQGKNNRKNINGKRPLCLYGPFGCMKSSLLKQLAFIVCRIKEEKFGIHQINLDLFNDEQILQSNNNSQFKLSIIEQVIAKCVSNCQENQQKIPTNTAFPNLTTACINFHPPLNLLQSPQSISLISEKTNEKEEQERLLLEQNPEFQRFTPNDWIIIDTIDNQTNQQKLELVIKQVIPFQNSKQIFINGMTQTNFKIHHLQFIVETQSLENFSCNLLSDMNLVFIQNPPYTLKEEFLNWMHALGTKHEFFADIYLQKHLKFHFQHLIFPCLQKMIEIIDQNKVFFYMQNAIQSQKFMLLNCLKFVETQLSELKKIMFSYGKVHISDFKKIKSKKKLFQTASPKKKIALQSQSQVKLTENDLFLFDFVIKSPEIKKISNQNILKFLNYVFSKNGKARNDFPIIEALILQSLLITLFPIIKANAQTQFSQYFLQLVFNLALHSNYKLRKTKFACGFLDIFISKPYFRLSDFGFDLQIFQWVKWIDLKLRDMAYFSNSFQTDYGISEVSNLNPRLKQCQFLKKYFIEQISCQDVAGNIKGLVDTEEVIFCHTSFTKQAQFLLDYMIAYNRNLLFSSANQSGKSTLLKNKILQMNQQLNKKDRTCSYINNHKILQFTLSGFSTAESLTYLLRKSLCKYNENSFQTGNNFCTHILLDDLHMVEQNFEGQILGIARSLVEQQTFYSYDQMKFYKIRDSSIIGCYSYSADCPNNIFDKNLIGINAQLASKMSYVNLTELDYYNMYKIFEVICHNLILEEETNSQFSKQILKNFCHELMRSKNLFLQISKLFNINLSLEQSFNLLKCLQIFDWSEVESKQQIFRQWIYAINNSFGDAFVQNKFDSLIDFENIENYLEAQLRVQEKQEDLIKQQQEFMLQNSNAILMKENNEDKSLENSQSYDQQNLSLSLNQQNLSQSNETAQQQKVNSMRQQYEDEMIQNDQALINETGESSLNDSKFNISDESSSEAKTDKRNICGIEKEIQYLFLCDIEQHFSREDFEDDELLSIHESDFSIQQEEENQDVDEKIMAMQSKIGLIELKHKEDSQIMQQANINLRNRNTTETQRSQESEGGMTTRKMEKIHQNMLEEEKRKNEEKFRKQIERYEQENMLEGQHKNKKQRKTKVSLIDSFKGLMYGQSGQSSLIKQKRDPPKQFNSSALEGEINIKTRENPLQMQEFESSQDENNQNNEESNETFEIIKEQQLNKILQELQPETAEKQLLSMYGLFGIKDFLSCVIYNTSLGYFKQEQTDKMIQNRNKLLYYDQNMLINEEEGSEGLEESPEFILLASQKDQKDVQQFFLNKLNKFLQMNFPFPDNNISGIYAFLNLMVFNSSCLFYEISKLAFDFSIPQQHLCINTYISYQYSLHLLKFTSFLLNKQLFVLQFNEETQFGTELHNQFIEQIYNYILPEIIFERKKVIFALIFNFSVVSQKQLCLEIRKQVVQIFEDLNCLFSNSEFTHMFPEDNYKSLLMNIKKIGYYEGLNETQLKELILNRLHYNVKFILVFENQILNFNKQENELKSITPINCKQQIFNSQYAYKILFRSYPQVFNKFKSKTIEDFVQCYPFIKLKISNVITTTFNQKMINLTNMIYSYQCKIQKEAILQQFSSTTNTKGKQLENPQQQLINILQGQVMNSFCIQ